MKGHSHQIPAVLASCARIVQVCAAEKQYSAPLWYVEISRGSLQPRQLSVCCQLDSEWLLCRNHYGDRLLVRIGKYCGICCCAQCSESRQQWRVAVLLQGCFMVLTSAGSEYVSLMHLQHTSRAWRSAWQCMLAISPLQCWL